MANHLASHRGRPKIEFGATTFGDGVSDCRLDHLRSFGLKAELFEDGGNLCYRELLELFIARKLAGHGTPRVGGSGRSEMSFAVETFLIIEELTRNSNERTSPY